MWFFYIQMILSILTELVYFSYVTITFISLFRTQYLFHMWSHSITHIITWSLGKYTVCDFPIRGHLLLYWKIFLYLMLSFPQLWSASLPGARSLPSTEGSIPLFSIRTIASEFEMLNFIPAALCIQYRWYQKNNIFK